MKEPGHAAEVGGTLKRFMEFITVLGSSGSVRDVNKLRVLLDEVSYLPPVLISVGRSLSQLLKAANGLLDIFEKHRVSSVAELEEKIEKGEIEEHPAYEDYLEALALLDTLREAEARLSKKLRRAPPETRSCLVNLADILGTTKRVPARRA